MNRVVIARALGVAAFIAVGLVIGWFLFLRSERPPTDIGDSSALTKAAGGSSEAGAATSRLRPASVISVRGLVVDTERRPVAAATVMVLSQGAVGNPTEPRAQTDDRGSFEFDVITPVRDVRIAHPAYYDLALDRVPEPRGNLIDLGTLVLRSRTGIVGIVRRADGSAAAGVVVTMSPCVSRELDLMTAAESRGTPRRALAETASGWDGQFAFEGFSPGCFDLVARQESPSPFMGTASHVVVAAAETARVSIVLKALRARRGRVVDQDRKPVGAAAVRIMSALPAAFGETNLDVVATTSDSEGWFDVVVPLAEDIWWLSIEAEKPGVGTGSVTYRPEKVPTEICLVKLTPARRLTVRFIDSQTSKPVPNVRCAVKGLPPTPLEAIRIADDSGTATVADVPEGATSIFVLVDSTEWALAPKEGVSLTLGEPFTIPAVGDAAIEVSLVGSGMIRGVVIDRTTGIGVSGVLVEGAAIENLQQLFAKGARARATSGKDGEFVLTGLPRCPIHLITLSNEWLCAPDGWDGRPVEGKNKEAFFGTQTLEREREISGVLVKVVPAARIEGSVVDPQGIGIVGARVDPGLPNLDIRVLARSDEGWYRKTMTTVTDGQGRFVLRAVWPSLECRLRATIEGLPKAWSAPFAVEPGAHIRGVVISAAGAGKVSLVVTDHRGGPAGGVRIFLSEREFGRKDMAASTSPEGTVTFAGVKPGKYFVALDPRSSLRSGPLKVRPGTAIDVGAGSSEHRIQLEPQEVVWGAVVDERGSPIPDALVSVQSVDPAYRRGGAELGRTGPAGGFRFIVNFDTDYEVVSVRSGLAANPDSSPASTQDRARVPVDFVPRGNATIRRGEYTMIRVVPK